MFACFIVAFGLLFGTTQGTTNVGGVLLADTVWTSSGSANPYNLISDVQVPRNVTLTIQAGVIINYDQGDFEIFIKGFLKVQGTSASGQRVIFQGGLGNNSKWMIQFQGTQLSQSSINYAQFIGPKNALQLTNAASGLQQNTDTLVIQSSRFASNTQIGANGNYPRASFPSVPSLEVRSSALNQVAVTSLNTNSEPIRIINSTVFYATFYPRAGNEGVRMISCTVRNLTVLYDSSNNYGSGAGQVLQIITSDVINATTNFPPYSYGSGPTFAVRRSTIRDFTFFSGMYGSSIQNLIFEDSSMYNISVLKYVGSWWWWGGGAASGISIRNCKFTLGNLTFPQNYGLNLLSIQNSVLTKVNIVSVYQDNVDSATGRQFTMFNVSFIDGALSLPLSEADISYSTITLVSPPLFIGGNSRISCSSIGRSRLILQSNTIGINATGLTLTDSTVKNFAIGLQVKPPNFNTVTISRTDFYSNTQYNVDNIGSYNLTATGVYWGTNNPALIVSKLHDYWQGVLFVKVFYTNYSSKYLPAESACTVPQSDFTIISPTASG